MRSFPLDGLLDLGLTLGQKKEQQKAENAEGTAGGKKKKVTAAQLRVQKGRPALRAPLGAQLRGHHG
jgi:hypothetical protein